MPCGDKLKFPRCWELISLEYSHDAKCVRNQTSVCPWEISTHLNPTGPVLFTYCKHLFGICFTTQQGVISESEKLSSYNRLISERWFWWAVKGKVNFMGTSFLWKTVLFCGSFSLRVYLIDFFPLKTSLSSPSALPKPAATDRLYCNYTSLCSDTYCLYLSTTHFCFCPRWAFVLTNTTVWKELYLRDSVITQWCLFSRWVWSLNSTASACLQWHRIESPGCFDACIVTPNY